MIQIALCLIFTPVLFIKIHLDGPQIKCTDLKWFKMTKIRYMIWKNMEHFLPLYNKDFRYRPTKTVHSYYLSMEESATRKMAD